MLFLLKIAITPVLVAAVSLAARWWGPTVGGVLMGLPWFTGPVLFVLVQDKGIDFGVAACIGIELGVVCISAFILAYGLVALRPLAALLGERRLLYAVSAWATQGKAVLALGTRATPTWSGCPRCAEPRARLLLLPRPAPPHCRRRCRGGTFRFGCGRPGRW